jgi:hypothetical protein
MEGIYFFHFKEPWTTEASRTTTTKVGKMILTDRRASEAERKRWPTALTGGRATTSPNAECKLLNFLESFQEKTAVF